MTLWGKSEDTSKQESSKGRFSPLVMPMPPKKPEPAPAKSVAEPTNVQETAVQQEAASEQVENTEPSAIEPELTLDEPELTEPEPTEPEPTESEPDQSKYIEDTEYGQETEQAEPDVSQDEPEEVSATSTDQDEPAYEIDTLGVLDVLDELAKDYEEPEETEAEPVDAEQEASEQEASEPQAYEPADVAQPEQSADTESDTETGAKASQKKSKRKSGLMRLIKKLLGKDTNTKADSDEPPTERYLYILIEKYQPNLSEYFEAVGIHVKTIRMSVEDMKLDIMQETGMARVLVLEQGNGVFTNTDTRKDIQDLVGLCQGEKNEITIFTTNSILKSEVNKRTLGKAATEVVWEQYYGVPSVVDYLNNQNEVYLGADEVIDDTETGTRIGYDDLLRLLPKQKAGLEDTAAKQVEVGANNEIGCANLFLEVIRQQESKTEQPEDFDDSVIQPVQVKY